MEGPQQRGRGRTHQEPNNYTVLNMYELYSLSTRIFPKMVKNKSIEKKYQGHATIISVTLNQLFNLYEPVVSSTKQYHIYVEGLNDRAHKKYSV